MWHDFAVAMIAIIVWQFCELLLYRVRHGYWRRPTQTIRMWDNTARKRS